MIRKVIRRLLRPTEIVTPARKRVVVIPHLIVGAAQGLGPFIDPGSYGAPIFASIFSVAGNQVWGLAFLAAGLSALYVLITGSWRAFIMSNTLTMFLASAWFLFVVKGRVSDGHRVSLSYFGLWLFVVATCLVAAVFPTVVTLTRERRFDAVRNR